MFGFLKRKKKTPTVYSRPEHCISRKDIDPDALKVLYRLSSLGYTAYLVGGGVRDLLMGRKPKDFDVGTSAKPNEVKRAFRNCFLIGRRFRLAHVRFGEKVIETATFRRTAQTVGEIIEHAAEGPQEDNTFGTPETDAYRRDFTVNGLFYNIEDFSVIDWVGGMKDIKDKVIRSIGDPSIRFQEDPVRMMRAVKFSARLGFTIERKTLAAMKKYHSCILTAATPRVCEEVFRLFPYGKSAEAFKLMWETGLLGDLLPELSAHIDRSGGAKCSIWKYLSALDKYETMMAGKGLEVSNGLRAAVLMTTMLEADPKDGAGRRIMQTMMSAIKIPKATYFTAVLLMESRKRLTARPQRGKARFVHNRDFLDALDYNRIVLRAEKRIVVAGYHGVRKYMADKRAAAAEAVSNAYTTEELEDAAAKFKGSKAEGVLRLRLAKSYFDSANYDSALEIYESFKDKAPDGFEGVPVVGKAQCLEALGKFDEARAAFDAFAEANEKSFLALTAKLGSARCIAQAGDRAKAIETLEALKASVGDDELSKSRVESTLQIVKRYEKRAERSLFEAADAAQKQLEAEAAKDDAAKKPEVEAPKAEAKAAPEAPAKAE